MLRGNIKPETAEVRPISDEVADPEADAAGYRVRSDRYVRLGDDRTDREGENANRWVLTVEVSTEEEIQIPAKLLWLDAE